MTETIITSTRGFKPIIWTHNTYFLFSTGPNASGEVTNNTTSWKTAYTITINLPQVPTPSIYNFRVECIVSVKTGGSGAGSVRILINNNYSASTSFNNTSYTDYTLTVTDKPYETQLTIQVQIKVESTGTMYIQYAKPKTYLKYVATELTPKDFGVSNLLLKQLKLNPSSSIIFNEDINLVFYNSDTSNSITYDFTEMYSIKKIRLIQGGASAVFLGEE